MEEGSQEVDGADPILFRVKLTEDEVAAFRRYHHRLLFRRPFRWLAWIAVAVLSTIAVWYMAQEGPEITAVLILVSCICFILWLLERSWATRRHYRRHPEDYLETEVRLTAQWVSYTNDDGRGEFAWRLFGGVLNTCEGILLFSQDRNAVLWLPSRLFEGTGIRERVLDMAEQNAVRVSHR